MGRIIIKIPIKIRHLLTCTPGRLGKEIQRERRENSEKNLKPRTLRKAGEGWLHPRMRNLDITIYQENIINSALQITLNYSLQMGQA